MHPLKIISNTPNSVSIEITTKCPLQCKYCDRKSGSGTNISYEEFLVLKSRLNEMPALDRIVFCGIGESLVHKDFYRMIHEFKEYKITIITSGTILLNYDEMNRYNNVDMLIFSIDATSEHLMKSICGETYNFHNLVKNVENYKAYNKKMRGMKGYITSVLNCTINTHNIEEIPKLVDFAVENKFNIIHYSLPWAQEDFISSNMKILKIQFALAQEKAKKNKIITDDPFHSYCCVTGSSILPFINLEGDIFPCGYALNKKYSTGNVLSHDINTIWNSPEYIKFKSGELCSDCYLIRMGLIEQEAM